MTDETYNGWKNYPTWAVHLWLTNDQGSDEMCREMAAEAAEEENPRYEFSHALKELIRGEWETDDADIASDLLGFAFDCVDWYEIADAFFEMALEIPA